ncbi:MAG: hypothetical protein DMF84_24540 [Acidobacteria bacterium]|nr:MAG: hypothetical protein DMF84_24540 [Acidobacteriota bacterium]
MPLWAIVPELTLASAFLLLLVAAPFTSPRTTRAVYVSATAVLLVAAAFTVRMLPWSDQNVFEGRTDSID